MFVNHINSARQITNGFNLNRWHVRFIWIACFGFYIFQLIGCQKQPGAPSESPTEAVKLADPLAAEEFIAPIQIKPKSQAEVRPEEQSDQPKVSPPPQNVENSQDFADVPPTYFLNDYDEAELPKFKDADLHKNLTLIILAAQPDLRARKILKPISQSLTEQEKIDAVELILAQDYKFLKLQRRRSEILEHARTGDDVESELKRIDAETVATSQELIKFVLQSIRKKSSR